MDACEATRIVFSRIQSLDPENASKIMGLLLIQDHGEKEMIRLAFGPEALVHSVVLKARNDLGLSSNTPSTPSTPSSPSPFSNPISISRQNSSNSSSRFVNAGTLNHNFPHSLTLPTPSASSPSSWAPSVFSDLQTQDDLMSSNSTSINGIGSDLIDEFQLHDQLSFLNDSSPTLNPKNPDLYYAQLDSATNPSGNSDSMLFPSYWGASMNGNPHRRSFSVTDVCLGSDDAAGFGWKPCLYFARGYCKNGTSCRFLHSGFPDSAAISAAGETPAIVGSPSNLDVVEHCQEILRSKTSQQQRLAAASQLMASSSFPYNKCMNFLLQQQQNDTQRAAAALMMGEDVHKFGRSRLERSEFPSPTGGGMVNPSSRQIYLTFPADSTFREEDVSNYFSIYGPVQDVRIPYQQKRMFGFVTFVYPETVKLILAKGNPHFVCDARVLVKPYKEKGKVPDKYRQSLTHSLTHSLSFCCSVHLSSYMATVIYICRKQQQQQQSERGELSACTTPTGLDSRDPYDLQLGARMYYNTQDMLLRRKLEEQADLQQAIELQGRRLMSLQLLDAKKHQSHHHRNLSAGACIASPTNTHSLVNQTSIILPSDRNSPEVQENCASPSTAFSASAAASDDKQQQQGTKASIGNNNDKNGNCSGNGKQGDLDHGENDVQESLEHNLPDSPFASPTKSAYEQPSIFSTASVEADRNSAILATSPSANSNLITSPLLPATSTLDMASFKSCFFQMPRFSSGHGAVGL